MVNAGNYYMIEMVTGGVTGGLRLLQEGLLGD